MSLCYSVVFDYVLNYLTDLFDLENLFLNLLVVYQGLFWEFYVYFFTDTTEFLIFIWLDFNLIPVQLYVDMLILYVELLLGYSTFLLKFAPQSFFLQIELFNTHRESSQHGFDLVVRKRCLTATPLRYAFSFFDHFHIILIIYM